MSDERVTFEDEVRHALRAANGEYSLGRIDPRALWSALIGRYHLELQHFPKSRVASSMTHPSGRGQLRRRAGDVGYHPSKPTWWKPATAALLGAGAVALGIGVWASAPKQQAAVSPSSHYATQPGERMTVTLVDGLRVTLAPASSIRLVTGSPSASRSEPLVADISGEVLFSVAPEVDRPVTVSAHGVVTRVLGTEFIVRAYDASHVRVAVREGRVSVYPQSLTASNAVVVAASQRADILRNSPPVVTNDPDNDDDFLWADGTLVLRDVPLHEAFLRLSRWYGMEFRSTDVSLLSLKLDAAFPASFSDEQMTRVAEVLGVHVARSDSVVTFSKFPVSPPPQD